MSNRKKILIFGANSYLAKKFTSKVKDCFEIVKVFNTSRNIKDELSFNFFQADRVLPFAKTIEGPIDGIVFFQGLNPSRGCHDMTFEHFNKMVLINLVTPCLLIKELNMKIAKNASVIFFSSNSKSKGSYDPSYGAAKAGIVGLVNSLARTYTSIRFNMITLGLVRNSPVFYKMTKEFRIKHQNQMFNNELINADSVTESLLLLLTNQNFNKSEIVLDGGYR